MIFKKSEKNFERAKKIDRKNLKILNRSKRSKNIQITKTSKNDRKDLKIKYKDKKIEKKIEKSSKRSKNDRKIEMI